MKEIYYNKSELKENLNLYFNPKKVIEFFGEDCESVLGTVVFGFIAFVFWLILMLFFPVTLLIAFLLPLKWRK